MAGKRPRGYAEWNPAPATLLVLAQVQEVLDEYSAQLPLTARQIFYRLVGAYGYDKTEQAYARLCEYLVRARRAQMISFSAIRDDGTISRGGGGYDDAEEFWRTVKSSGEHYRRDRQQGQPYFIELWCEAAGMVPQLVSAVREYSVPVYSTGGFSSVTVTHEVAQRVLDRDRPTVFLHVGDYDPSGESIFESMSCDIGAFVVHSRGGTWSSATGETFELKDGSNSLFKPARVALTGDQVEEHDLPTAPPKRSDKRSANWLGSATCQLEAMPPDLLARTVRDAVESRLDRDEHEEQRATEDEERTEIQSRIADLFAVLGLEDDD